MIIHFFPTLRRYSGLLTLMLLFAPATPAAAQEADSATAAGWLRRVCPGQQVMVSTTLRERVAGECRGLQDARLVVRQGGAERSLPLVGIDSVWVREPGTRSGTITGAAVGAAVLGTLGTLFVTVFCESSTCGQEYLRYGLGGAASGAFSGAILGAMIGGGRTVWIRVHPR